MKREELANLALNNQDFTCYIIDINSYKLLYANDTAKKILDFPLEGSYLDLTCYNFLHDRDTPCEFCNISTLIPNQTAQREMLNERNNRYYSYFDKLIEVDGKPAKLTFGFDTSEQKKEFDAFSHKISFEETLVRCIHTLIEDSDIEKAINNLLSIVGDYYQADRAYIFEIDPTETFSTNTYEWSLEKNLATIDVQPVLVLDQTSAIIERFKKDKEIAIYNPNELEPNSALYKILVETNTSCALLVPMYEQGNFSSFLGVDNPKRMMTDLNLLHSVSIFVADDIKKRKILKQLEHLSYTDILTGLQNRNKYILSLEEMDVSKLSSLGFIHATVNGLKKMNELYGERYGDSILKQLAELLQKHIVGELYRLSGDEFIALCPDISQSEFDQIIHILRTEEASISEFSFAVGGVWQNQHIDIHLGLNHANEIMFAEKQNYYKSQLTDKVQSRANSVEIMLDEIRSGCFSIYLQPKVNLLTGEISGAEALIRKHNTSGALIPPDRFIPIYENEGTIRHLDFFVLEEVCLLLKKLIEENRPLKIAVNFSRVTFIAYDFIDEVIITCAKHKIPHEYIKVEITESIDKMDFEFFNKKLKALAEAGFEISLDDFGAKHSNLLMLTTNEFSEVKIDKGLIDNISTSSQNRTLVRNIIRTIKELGKSTCLAEGIETKEQKERLLDYGCQYGQGYYFYKPMPVLEFLLIYRRNEIKENFILNDNTTILNSEHMLDPESMHAIIEALPLALNIWNHKRENILCNQHAVDLFGLKNKDEYLQKFFSLSPEKQPDGRLSSEAALTFLNEARNNGYVKFNWLHCKPNGEEIPSEVILALLDLKGEEGDSLIAGFTRDLRPQLAGDDRTQKLEDYFFDELSDRQLFSIISELAAEWFWVYNNKTAEIQFFGKGREILGLSAEKIPFPSSIINSNLVYEDDLETFLEFNNALKRGENRPTEVRFISLDGSIKYYNIVYKTVFNKNGEPRFSIGKTYNIHEKKTLETLSQIDQLTSCYNKATSEALMRSALAMNPENNHTLFVFDIDNFKAINDNLGHHFGDTVLRDIGRELLKHFRGNDIIGRIGGDEFILFLKNSSDINLLEEKANIIGDILRKSYKHEGKVYNISGSIGIATYQQDAKTYDDLFNAADKALYSSKNKGKNCYTFYTNELLHSSKHKLTVLENADRQRNSFLDADFELKIYDILYREKSLENALNLALQEIGLHLNVDRAYLLETLDQGMSFGVTYEWCQKDISTQIGKLQNFRRENLGDFFSALHYKDVVYSNNITMDECKELYGLVKDQEIKSFLFVQARGEHYPNLVFGLDDCKLARTWTEREINSMRNLVKMLSIFMLSKCK